ncbi:MAG: peptidoglycan editing factor PgeF [Clostridia bacterium]|nr:peptidoglycan editing factor PgeF [Clostridia bacterium]
MKDYTNKDVILMRKNNVYYLQFKILQQYHDKLRHAITLRHGGVSSFPTGSLNFRVNGKDAKENVLKNIEIICKEAEFDQNNIYKARQNHTDKILILDNVNKEKYHFEDISKEEYDGYITKDKNIATLVTTADCNPIIIYDAKKNIVANVHSGWKGTIKRIYMKAIDILINDFSSNIEDLIVCIGPSIRKCCFSSEDEEFKSKFTYVWQNENEYIYYEDGGKRFHIDLAYVIKKDLLSIGIKEENIADANICTMCHSDDFFSYRFATKEKYDDYGLMATIVELL